jgi:hypothetical protein
MLYGIFYKVSHPHFGRQEAPLGCSFSVSLEQLLVLLQSAASWYALCVCAQLVCYHFLVSFFIVFDNR